MNLRTSDLIRFNRHTYKTFLQETDVPNSYSRTRNYLYTSQEKRRESEFPPTGVVKQGQVFQNVNIFSDSTITVIYSKAHTYLYIGEVRKPRQRERMWDCYSLKCKLIFWLYGNFNLLSTRHQGKSPEPPEQRNSDVTIAPHKNRGKAAIKSTERRLE